MKCYSLTHLSDPVLLHALTQLVAQDRVTTAAMLAHLAEVDARKLYRPAAYPSMFAWCVGELGLSEDAAAKRIRAARIARQFPAVFSMLADGRLHLSTLVLLAPHLTPESADELLAAAANQPRAGLEQLLAERFPRPDLPTLVQAITNDEPAPGRVAELSCEPAPGRVEELSCELAPGPVQEDVNQHAPGRVDQRARVTPLAPGRFALQATIDQTTHDKLRYAQALLGHSVPSGDLAQVLDRALDALVAKLEQRRFAATARSRAGGRRHAQDTRYVPAAVRRLVWQRDGGRCTFVGDSGHRCEARTRLEFDHIEPFARGGQATPARMRLRCRAHNQLEAERTYGADFMRHKRQEARRGTTAARGTAQGCETAWTHDTGRARDAAAAQERAVARALDRERAAARQARADEVIPWLRGLGFRADEARRAAALCDDMPDAPLEARVRAALASLAPSSARKESGHPSMARAWCSANGA